MNHAAISHQTNCDRTGNNYRTRMIPIIFLLVILFFSAWFRFDGITEQGIEPGDTFRYVKEAKIWVDGQPPTFCGGYYRPASYFLQAAAIKIFGYNDYSIKLLHGIMDMISIILIFLIASILSRELWVGVVSSFIYAFLPAVVNSVRSEMFHVESTFFVLLALLFFVLFTTRQNKNIVKFILLFISGVCMGLAANTHTDLAFLAPGYVFYLFIKSYNSQNKKESLKEFLILASIFTLSFFTPYLLGFFLFGFNKVLQVLFKEISIANSIMTNDLGHFSKPSIFFDILSRSIKFYFGKQFYLIDMLLVGPIFIILYFKVKKIKKSDSLLAYFPIILIFSYAFLISFFLNTIVVGRALMPLLPLFIFILTQWYYKFFKQFFGKYSLIVFFCFFSMLFLLNPKIIPNKAKYKSQYRLIYDIMKDDVNPRNKLLIAPVTIYSLDLGYQCDLYFGKNAVYLCALPLNNEYNLKSLNELLMGMNIRYIFLGKGIDRRLLNPNHFLSSSKTYKQWLKNDKSPYLLEKDLEIIHTYIKSKGGFLINKNLFGEIYYLTGEKVAQNQNLIANGSFEHWWKGVPIGKWELVSGRVFRSVEATEGSGSIRFDPDDKNGSRIIWSFGKPLPGNASKLRTRLDVRADESNKYVLFFTARINGEWKRLKPNIVEYTGKGEWGTLSEDFSITQNMKILIFHLMLRAGARDPAFADNLSVTITD